MAIINVEPKALDFADRPLLAQAFAAWQGWAGAGAAPTWREVVLVDVPAKLLPTTVVVDVVDGGADYVYRFWGTGMRDLYNCDETGRRLTRTLQPQFLKATFEQLDAVRERGAPAYYHVTLRQPNGVAALKRNLRLPVIDRPGEVGKIITVSELEPLRMSAGDNLGEMWREPTTPD